MKDVAENDLTTLQGRYASEGCSISLESLTGRGEFLASPAIVSQIRKELEAMTKIVERKITIDKPGCRVLLDDQSKLLKELVKSKFYMEAHPHQSIKTISIPQAKTTATAEVCQRVTCLKIGHSVLKIAVGDLATQGVSLVSNFNESAQARL